MILDLNDSIFHWFFQFPSGFHWFKPSKSGSLPFLLTDVGGSTSISGSGESPNHHRFFSQPKFSRPRESLEFPKPWNFVANSDIFGSHKILALPPILWYLKNVDKKMVDVTRGIQIQYHPISSNIKQLNVDLARATRAAGIVKAVAQHRLVDLQLLHVSWSWSDPRPIWVSKRTTNPVQLPSGNQTWQWK